MSGHILILRTFGAAILVAVSSFALFASAAAASQAVTLTKVSLRAGPVDKSSELGTIGQGTKVSVVWCGPEVKFCLVRFHGQAGWVLADDLGATAAGAASDETTGKGSNGAVASADRQASKQSALKEAAPINPNSGGGSGIVFAPVNNYQVIKP